MSKERVMTVTILEGSGDEARIEELKNLVESTKSLVVSEISQKIEINPKTYIGSGKLEEIKDLIIKQDIDCLVFNNELTGSQMRNIEEIVSCKILDRTDLILDIFATRARTRESKLKVKLAQLEYRLPRLSGFNTYLSRQGGGIGTRGPGEMKLETDRRSIEREITSIKNKLRVIKERRKTSQKLRKNSPIKEIALVGYTNAGKSTILNGLVSLFGVNEKKVYADDRLFASLDTSIRKIKYDNLEMIVSDTVGLIKDLPDKLREAFNSTFEELVLADLILLVVDVTSVDMEIQKEATRKALMDLSIDFDKVIFVYNKVDKLGEDFFVSEKENHIKISALNDSHIHRLMDMCTNFLYGKELIGDIFYSFENIGEYENLKGRIKILEEDYREEGVYAKVKYRLKEFENGKI